MEYNEFKSILKEMKLHYTTFVPLEEFDGRVMLTFTLKVLDSTKFLESIDFDWHEFHANLMFVDNIEEYLSEELDTHVYEKLQGVEIIWTETEGFFPNHKDLVFK